VAYLGEFGWWPTPLAFKACLGGWPGGIHALAVRYLAPRDPASSQARALNVDVVPAAASNSFWCKPRSQYSAPGNLHQKCARYFLILDRGGHVPNLFDAEADRRVGDLCAAVRRQRTVLPTTVESWVEPLAFLHRAPAALELLQGAPVDVPPAHRRVVGETCVIQSPEMARSTCPGTEFGDGRAVERRGRTRRLQPPSPSHPGPGTPILVPPYGLHL